MVAGYEIHLPEVPVLGKNFMDQAHLFDEFLPIKRRHSAEAGNDIADREIVGGLQVIDGGDQFLGGLLFGGEPFIQPFHRRGARGVLI